MMGGVGGRGVLLYLAPEWTLDLLVIHPLFCLKTSLDRGAFDFLECYHYFAEKK